MVTANPDEVMDVVIRRRNVLDALTEGDCQKRDLIERLDVSRSTVDRGVHELERAGLVERDGGNYRLSLAGRLAFEEFQACQRSIHEVAGGEAILSVLDSDAEFDTAILEGAEIVVAERHAPYRPVAAASDVIDRATFVRAFAPAVIPQQVETYRQNILDGDMAAEFVLSEKVIELLITSHADALRDSLLTGHVEIRRATEALPYSLVLAETPNGPEMCVLIYADSGVKGFVGNGTPRAVSWARDTLCQIWNAAEEMSFGVE